MEQFANPEILQTMPMGERLINAFMVMGLGMGVVFIVLVVLMFSVSLMGLILNRKKNTVTVEKEVQPIAPAPAPEKELQSDQEDPDELIAVLMAAIRAMQQEGPRLRITDVRVQGAPVSAWTQAALAQNTRRLSN